MGLGCLTSRYMRVCVFNMCVKECVTCVLCVCYVGVTVYFTCVLCRCYSVCYMCNMMGHYHPLPLYSHPFPSYYHPLPLYSDPVPSVYHPLPSYSDSVDRFTIPQYPIVKFLLPGKAVAPLSNILSCWADQCGSIDTSNTNIGQLVIILWQNILGQPHYLS